MRTPKTLPLRYHTASSWAERALASPLELLNDHAHLEKKAAQNALDLVLRWPNGSPPAHWVIALNAIARDEVEHFTAVVKLLDRRGGELSRHHKNPYASGLRDFVRLGTATRELIDRLMVSALIEARSCERFWILADVAPDKELAKLYQALWASEHGHYKIFLELAGDIVSARERDQRWDEWLNYEAELIASQAPGARMHSGEPISCEAANHR